MSSEAGTLRPSFRRSPDWNRSPSIAIPFRRRHWIPAGFGWCSRNCKSSFSLFHVLHNKKALSLGIAVCPMLERRRLDLSFRQLPTTGTPRRRRSQHYSTNSDTSLGASQWTTIRGKANRNGKRPRCCASTGRRSSREHGKAVMEATEWWKKIGALA